MNPQPSDTDKPAQLLLWFSFVLFAVVLVRTAWAYDDAYISFRTVYNFVHGYGLRWNIDERVQTFTNPLWVLIMSPLYAITREVYFTSIFLSIALVLVTVWVVAKKIASSYMAALFALAGLLFSRAFIDYATSGLEQPLLYVLLALFIWQYAKFDDRVESFGKLTLIAALSATTRMDTILIYLPVIALVFWQHRSWKAVKYGVLGFIPFILWELFAVFYYGFPFPNTYYAKVLAGIPAGEVIHQGFVYYLDTFSTDPLTLLVIGVSIAVACFSKVRGYVAIGLGLLLYLLYIAKVGGDFMSGRFFALPVLGGIALLSRFAWERTQLIGGIIVLIVIGLSAKYPSITTDATFGTKDVSNIRAAIAGNTFETAIGDQRFGFYPSSGLLRALRNTELPINNDWTQKGKTYALKGDSVAFESTIGLIGYYAGPRVHIVDHLALADPLLARLPAVRDYKWRIGHLQRSLPDGYRETILSGKNQLVDSGLSRYYDKLSIITRGPLFSFERFKTILAMNVGMYTHLLGAYWDEAPQIMKYAQINNAALDGSTWDDPRVIKIRRLGLRVLLDSTSHASTVKIGSNESNSYMVQFYRNDKLLGQSGYEKSLDPHSLIRANTITVPLFVKDAGYNRIEIYPFSLYGTGNDQYSIGYVQLID